MMTSASVRRSQPRRARLTLVLCIIASACRDRARHGSWRRCLARHRRPLCARLRRVYARRSDRAARPSDCWRSWATSSRSTSAPGRASSPACSARSSSAARSRTSFTSGSCARTRSACGRPYCARSPRGCCSCSTRSRSTPSQRAAAQSRATDPPRHWSRRRGRARPRAGRRPSGRHRAPPHVREWVSSLLHAEVAVDMLVEAVGRLGRNAAGDDRRLALARMVRSLRPSIAEGDVRRGTRRCASTCEARARARRNEATRISPKVS